VNPLIAVLLGAVILGEHVGPRTGVAMALILGAVVWIQLAHRTPAPRPAQAPPGDQATPRAWSAAGRAGVRAASLD